MKERLPFAKRNYRGSDTRRHAFQSEEYQSSLQYSEDEYASSDHEYPSRMISTKSLRSLAILNNNHIKLNRRFYSQMIGNTTNDDSLIKSDVKDEDESADNTSYITFNEVCKNNLSSMEQEDATDEIKEQNSSGSIIINEKNYLRHYIDENLEIENEEDGTQTEEDEMSYPLLNSENHNNFNYKTMNNDERYEITNGTYKSISSVVKLFFKSKYDSVEDSNNICDEDVEINSRIDNNVIDILDLGAADIDTGISNKGGFSTGKDGDAIKLQKKTNSLAQHKNKLQKFVSRSESSKNNSIRTLKVDRKTHVIEGNIEDMESHIGNGIICRKTNSTFGNGSILVWSEEDEDSEINSVFIENADSSEKPFLVNCIIVVCFGLIIILSGFLIGVLMANLFIP